jgi:hypothetical protein
MKTRTGFVSNSSSASFIIGLSDLTGKQLYQITHHEEVAKEMPHDFGWARPHWDIDTTNDYVRGHASMDNFDMWKFLEVIGVDMDKVNWENG